ncbi:MULTISPECIES: surface lipoprotein assembly modifier [unclassified Acinetobacter]|uniref:surface lipoprotein assembly modifier n=1 Tax=unclassified Acinetobacter TaxID=196816 RepID=UPI0035BB58FA
MDGRSQQFGSSLRYLASPQQALQIGIDASMEDAKDPSERYKRYGTWLTWEQEWQKGISSVASLGYADKHYQGLDIFQIQRHDQEYFAHLALWHRALHWQGLTPRLNLLWQNNRSNHFAYNYQNKEAYIELSRSF